MTEIKEEKEKIVKKIEWKLGFGSGKANCRVCNTPITEKQQNIKLVNARVSGQLHSNPFDCSDERIEMLGLDETEGEKNE
jgi:hypothetical protein